MKIDQNGIPSVSATESTTTGQALGKTVTEGETPSATFGSLVNDMLAEFAGAAVIVIDPNTRSIYGASGAAGEGLASVVGSDPGISSDISPSSGQTGKSLEWEQTTNPSMPAEVKAAINAAVEAAKPKRSVSSLVTALLSGAFVDKAPCIMVDQANGYVRVTNPTTAGSLTTSLDALANAGDRVKITLAEPAAPGEPEKYVFEGGEVAA